MSTAMWKLEKDLCRCCHAEGSFKHLSDPCFLLGQEEIYSVMLQESLDIKVVPMTGPLSDATYTICEACVLRLRDASNFKRQVQECEERFKEMYSKNMIRGFEVKDEPLESDADMKHEFHSLEDDDDDDDDDDDAFLKFDDDADDSFEEHEEMVSVEIEGLPKTKGKGKAKPKPKSKKAAPVKKTKTKEKPIKLESEELTEAAVSGVKRKGPSYPKADFSRFCEIERTSNETKHRCTLCDHKFRTSNHWLHHYYKDHLKKKRPQCVLCHMVYAPWERMRHMENFHGWKPPTCKDCGRKFSFPHQVIDHQKQFHMGERNYTCQQCGSTFSNLKNLKQHISTHIEVKDFRCEYCSKAFKTAKYLRLHLKIHLDDRRYVCIFCDKPYVQLSNLKWHIRKHHPGVVDESDKSD